MSRSRDVYLRLVEEDEETSWLFGLVAFAVFEERRMEWMQHFEEQNEIGPTGDEIKNWYEQQPDAALVLAKADAEKVMQLYAEEVEEVMMERHRKDIENDVIVREIHSLRNLWADFGINVAGGLVSALLFAAILTTLAFTVFADTSPVNLGKWIGITESEVIENGE